MMIKSHAWYWTIPDWMFCAWFNFCLFAKAINLMRTVQRHTHAQNKNGFNLTPVKCNYIDITIVRWSCKKSNKNTERNYYLQTKFKFQLKLYIRKMVVYFSLNYTVVVCIKHTNLHSLYDNNEKKNAVLTKRDSGWMLIQQDEHERSFVLDRLNEPHSQPNGKPRQWLYVYFLIK